MTIAVLDHHIFTEAYTYIIAYVIKTDVKIDSGDVNRLTKQFRRLSDQWLAGLDGNHIIQYKNIEQKCQHL